MGQDLLQQEGGAVGGGDGVQVLVQRVHLAAHGAHGQVFDHGLDQIAQAAVHDLVRDGEADDGDDEDAENLSIGDAEPWGLRNWALGVRRRILC